MFGLSAALPFPIYFLLRERGVCRRMEGLSFRFPMYPAGPAPSLLRPTLETGPRFLMEEEEREPQTLVPHTKKCLLILFQCHCEVGTEGSGHWRKRALGQWAPQAVDTQEVDRPWQAWGGLKKWEEKESAKSDL